LTTTQRYIEVNAEAKRKVVELVWLEPQNGQPAGCIVRRSFANVQSVTQSRGMNFLGGSQRLDFSRSS